MENDPRPPEPPEKGDQSSARPEPFDSAQDRPVEEPPGPANTSSVRPEPVEGLRQPALEDQLARAKEDADKFRNNWQRSEADLANYKRRAEQERDEARRFASASLIINLLPILDDLERALASLDIRLVGLTWFDGIRLIHRKLQLVLESAGVSVIEAEGQPFDPRYHEAVTHAEGEEGKVLGEVQRGYKLHDRVLRPAMVIVGRGKEQGTGNTEQEGEKKEDNPS